MTTTDGKSACGAYGVRGYTGYSLYFDVTGTLRLRGRKGYAELTVLGIGTVDNH